MAGLRHPRLVHAVAGLLLPLVLLSARSGAAAPSPSAKPAAKPTQTPPASAPSAGTPPASAPSAGTPPDDGAKIDQGAEAEPPADSDALPTPEIDAAVPGADPAEVAALQQDARVLRDALFKARGRVSLVAAKLFTTRITLRLRSNLDRFYTVTNLTVRVDGAPVYVQASGMPSTDDDLFEVFAAPGSHTLSVSADLVARRDATYKFRFDHTATITVDTDERVSTRLLLRETGNMWRFAETKRGHSDMRVRLSARAKSTARRAARNASAESGGRK